MVVARRLRHPAMFSVTRGSFSTLTVLCTCAYPFQSGFKSQVEALEEGETSSRWLVPRSEIPICRDSEAPSVERRSAIGDRPSSVAARHIATPVFSIRVFS